MTTSFSFAVTSGAWSVLRSSSSAFWESARSAGMSSVSFRRPMVYGQKGSRTGITKITSLQMKFLSLSHYNLVHKFLPMPQALKKSRCEGCSGKRMGKLEKILAWELTKVRNKSEVIEEARKKTFGVIDGSLSSQEFGVRASISKVQRQSLLRGDIVKR